MVKTNVTRCPFCGRNWVRQHNYCPKNHLYSENLSENEYIKVFQSHKQEKMSKD